MSNSCGDCTVCCELWAISELNKPKHEMCSHCTGTGCGNYQQRPDACKGYECMFLQGDWPVGLRPDKCGVVFDRSKKGTVEALMFKKDFNQELVMEHIDILTNRHGLDVKGVYAVKPSGATL